MAVFFRWLLVYLSCFNICRSVQSTFVVNTNLGLIRGSILKSDGGEDFVAFRGIPYAKPPLKDLRFQEPEEFESWNGTLDATEDGARCIQINFMMSLTIPYLEGDEDCLFLNVYVSRKIFDAKNELSPVMVFIHGGGFVSGSGDYDTVGPQRFMDKDVVLVTLNYRLGPFGFLSTGDQYSPGNYGLLDQVLSLKWVQKHISNFGGDPNSVTIFGESAGAASVSFLVLSPLAKGLFHAAVHQSGNAFSEWACDVSDDFKIATNFIGDSLNCPTASEDLIKCLRKRPALDILTKSVQFFFMASQKKQFPIMFQPTVDRCRGSGAMIPDNPKTLLINGNLNTVPVITGVTKDEGIMSLLFMALQFGGIKSNSSVILNTVLPMLLPSLFKDERRGNNVIEKILTAFFNENNMELNQKLLTLIRVFNGEWYHSLDNYNKHLVKRGFTVYSYKYTFRGQQSWLEKLPEYANLPANFIDEEKIVAHGDELLLLFHSSYFKSSELQGDEIEMSDKLLNLWVNFAKMKKPFAEDYAIWTPIFYGQPNYIDLGIKTKMINSYFNVDRSLWNEIFKEHLIKTEL